MEHRAIACCDQALADVGLAGVAVLRQVRHDYFAGTTRQTMARYHRSAHDVPSDLN
jgi:hemoglobin